MERVLDLFNKYSSNISFTSKENFESYTLSIELTEINEKFIWDDFIQTSQYFSNRDECTITISVNEGEPFTFKFGYSEDNPVKIEDINDLVEPDSIIDIKYEVYKEQKNSTITIYELESVYKYLSNLKLDQLLKVLNSILDKYSLNKFEVNNEKSEIYYCSPLMVFASKNVVDYYDNDIEINRRRNIIEKRRNYTNPQNLSEYIFIPDDFNNDISETKTDIAKLFEKLKIIFSISFFANTSEIITLSSFKFGIIGHKYLDLTIDFNDIKVTETETETLYLIYRWIYEEGDISDKLDLSRNIISKYVIFHNKFLSVPRETLNSIQSAHAIYLKENVEKYIETKNKVAEITTELSVKSNEISQYFISSFKNNNITILTYFISIFVFNALSSNSKKIFTKEIYYLSMIFLLISVIYLVLSRIQVFRDLKLSIRYFYSMKRIYKDIFDPTELDNLFHKRQLKYNIASINKTAYLYTIVWIIEIILLGLITILLTFFYNLI